MNRRLLGLLPVVVALALVSSACGSDGGGGGGGGGGGSGGGGGGGGDGAGGGAATLTIENFAFHPSALTGAAGETLSITVTNNDDVEHSFTLDDGSIDQDVESGATQEVVVTFPDSGTLGWHCKYHPQMTGTLEVA